MIEILVIEPEKRPYRKSIEANLDTMQSLVGGMIQAIYPFEEPVALITNDEGKLLGLPLNRALTDAQGQVYDIIAGTFFLCGAPADSEDFVELNTIQLQYYTQLFGHIETFLWVNEKIIVVKG